MLTSPHLEAVLLAHPAVADCAVLERATDEGGEELVAYVVATAALSRQELRAFLGSEAAGPLPDTIVPVFSIPRDADGAIDRRRLSALAVPDDDLIARCEAHATRGEGVEAAAVLIENLRPALPLHLADVLPEFATGVHSSPLPVESHVPAAAAGPGADADPDVSERPPAISEGGVLWSNPDAPELLVETLTRAAESRGEQGLIYVEADGSERRQSYPDLLAAAERLLGGLRAQGLAPGDRVILQLERHQDVLGVFWACVLGGFLPVPLAVPPAYDRPSAPLQTLEGVWPAIGPATLVAPAAAAPDVSAALDRLGLAGARVCAIEGLAGDRDDRHHRARPDDLALLMLTSGSTGTAKAVQLTHRNLVTRSLASQQLNDFSFAEVSLNWMPLDHVAGLIYFHLRDVFLGCRQVHVPTSAVLTDPLSWLDYLERFRATVTFAPNFAFGLVNDRERELAARRWDLSSVRVVLNGAEAIVARTARRFVQRLARHGLRQDCMRPAWGMSETSSGVTYGDRFSLDGTTDDDPFVEVGRPIPTLAMRIVDSHGAVRREGEVGRLQVRGETVTRGYYNRPDLTADALSADGWFTTGDLGLLVDGRLTITGREKDVVIVNSVNYYCHAIEAVVEALDGVEPSYTAACAMRRPGADTDGLAIFFHPRRADDEALAALLPRIRAEVTSKAGISPDILVPVDRSAIPKTSLGKIQRVELAERLRAGQFAETLKKVDRLTGGPNTVPDWFFRKIWRRTQLRRDERLLGAGRAVLIVADETGLASSLRWSLEERNVRTVVASAGGGFARTGTGTFTLDPRREDDYRRLLGALEQDGLFPAQIVHLAGYEVYRGEATGATVDHAQRRHILGALALMKAIAGRAGVERPVRLTFVASCTQRVDPDDRVAYEKTPVLGLVKSFPQEVPGITCRHIDLHEPDPAAAAQRIVDELSTADTDREVAWRDGGRFVARLERIRFEAASRRPIPFAERGLYLVTGGAGGIGGHVCRLLLERFSARLLLIGRSTLDEGVGATIEALARTGGSVAYDAADVCDEARLEEVVTSYEARWGRRLDGVVHLAGVYRERSIAEETAEGLLASLRPKTLGTDVLHRLLARRGGGLFISSASVAGFFGGATIAAYSAANAFQSAFAEHHRGRSAVDHYCFNWSNWDDVGQSRGYQLKDLPRARGFLAMAPGHAALSLLIGLGFREPAPIIGLDGGHRHVRRYLADEADTVEKAVVYFTAPAQAGAAVLRSPTVTDRFGTALQPSCVQLDQMPVGCTGEIDRARLASRHRTGTGKRRGARPGTDAEKRLAEIWKRVLAVPDVNADDSFFELGGDSILAMRLIGRVRDEFSVDLPVRVVFDATSLSELAAAIDRQSPAAGARLAAVGVAVTDPAQLLERLDELGDAEVDALLRELGEGGVVGEG